MHRSSDIQIKSDYSKSLIVETISWKNVEDVSDWLKRQPCDKWKAFFDENGFLKVDSLISDSELQLYRELYDKFLDGKINASAHRHDLGNHEGRKTATENICQIMWPSIYVGGLCEGPIHQRAEAVAKLLLGDDMEFDFDMLISKAPHTNTITPWHQDESYWLDMPDKRSVSCWVPMDEAVPDNGCMWFVPGSHKKEPRPHHPVQEGVHVLTCEGSEDEGKPIALHPGGATFHHGRTMHYTRGNTTDGPRRAFITNFRPAAMVTFERQHNYTHGKEGLDGALKKGQGHTY